LTIYVVTVACWFRYFCWIYMSLPTHPPWNWGSNRWKTDHLLGRGLSGAACLPVHIEEGPDICGQPTFVCILNKHRVFVQFTVYCENFKIAFRYSTTFVTWNFVRFLFPVKLLCRCLFSLLTIRFISCPFPFTTIPQYSLLGSLCKRKIQLVIKQSTLDKTLMPMFKGAMTSISIIWDIQPWMG